MTTELFLQALEERIGRYDLLCHPYYKAWSAGELTREDLAHYAADYYPHVAAFPTYLSTLHARMDDGEPRRAVLRNLCGEEIAGRPHSELWLNFAEGMGADRDQVRAQQPNAEVRELMAEFRRVAGECSLVDVLAAFYAYESQVPRVAREKARGLMERYGADQATCEYFTLHQYADVEHSEVWRDLMEQEINAHPEQAEAALASAEKTAQSLWRVLDGMEARRMAAVQ
jgi:pyrroloquinoline-quinone synthase